jgi:hypothetical protein
MKKLYFLLVLLLSLTSSHLIAQDFEITLHDLEDFHSFPTTLEFAEDGNQDIWLIQSGGFDGDYLLKFSAGTWERISFDNCSNCFRGIHADNTGTIHLITNNGIYKRMNADWEYLGYDGIINRGVDFDSNNNLWCSYEFDGIEYLAKLIGNGEATLYPDYIGFSEDISVDDDDNVWFIFDDEIYKLNESSVEKFTPFFDPYEVEIGEEGKVWFATSVGSTGKIENGVMQEGILDDISTTSFYQAFSVDSKRDIIWASTQGTAGVYYFKDGVSHFIDSDDLFPGEVGLINESFVSSNGDFWAASNFESSVAQIFPTLILNTEDIQTSKMLYPNPATDIINIETGENIRSLTIHDSNGRQIQKINKNLINNVLDVSTLANGNYYIHTVDNQGNKQTQKFIILR